MIVGERLAAHTRQLRRACSVGQEHHQHRRVREPGHVGHERDQRLPLIRCGEDQDVGLLQIALGRRREGAGTQEPQQCGLDRLVEKIPMHAVAGDAGELVEARERRINW